MKTCLTCGQTKSLELFRRDKRKKDRHTAICKICAAEKCREWRKLNYEKVKAYEAIRYPGDKVGARQRYPGTPRERQRAAQRAWARANPDKVRDILRVKRARRRAAEGRHNSKDVARIRTLQKGRCAYCRKPLHKAYHLDHIVPIAKGGSNWPRNLQLLCASCNVSKHAKDPVEFAQNIGRLL